MVGRERANLTLMLFLLLAGTAGGIAGDNSMLGLLEISLIWGQYAKNRFFARWLKNERVVDQTTRVSNLTVSLIPLIVMARIGVNLIH